MDNLVEQLLRQQNECSLCWLKADGSPAATTVSFVWREPALWMTATAGSARVKALQRDPRVAVVVSGKGTASGQGCCVSLQGRITIIDEQAARDWFFPALAAVVIPDSPGGSAMMAGVMNTPENLLLRFVPERSLPWDSRDSLAMAGRL